MGRALDVRIKVEESDVAKTTRLSLFASDFAEAAERFGIAVLRPGGALKKVKQ